MAKTKPQSEVERNIFVADMIKTAERRLAEDQFASAVRSYRTSEDARGWFQMPAAAGTDLERFLRLVQTYGTLRGFLVGAGGGRFRLTVRGRRHFGEAL